jgi:ammonia channel protein AmtB
MKSIIIFVIWMLLWLVVGWKLGYEYVLSQMDSSVGSIVDTLMTNGIGSWSQDIVQQAQNKVWVLAEEQKEVLKEELKKQLINYVNQKIDDTF